MLGAIAAGGGGQQSYGKTGPAIEPWSAPEAMGEHG